MRQRIVRRERGAAERHRLEVRLPGLCFQRIEVESGLAEDRDGRIAMQPRLQQDLVPCRVGANHVETLAAGSDGGAPAVTGSRGLVDDQRADRAPARSLLVLVGPARVVGGRVPAEPTTHRIVRPRLEVGIVDQEDRDLALQVDALVVVPAALRRRDPVADEHEWRTLRSRRDPPVAARGPRRSRAARAAVSRPQPSRSSLRRQAPACERAARPASSRRPRPRARGRAP